MFRHSDALTGVANALSETAKALESEEQAEELKTLARQVRELQGYWHNDENAAELGRHGKRVPMRKEYKTLLVGHMNKGVNQDQMEDALASLAVEGWEVVATHADLTSQPKWAILLRRKVPA